MVYDFENEADKPKPDVWLPMGCCPIDVWEQFEPIDESPFVTVYEDGYGGLWAILNQPPTEDDPRMQPIGCVNLPPSAPLPNSGGGG